MSPHVSDRASMRRALELARLGEGLVEPNPQVGAVVTATDGRIIGAGWHARFGGPHAEIGALAAAGTGARGGTLHVTLEPCCHHGKTPPCTDAILAAGIARVVVGAEDPFPAVHGGGIAALRRSGVTVEVGVLEQEAVRLTAPFRMLVTQGRPWVIAKWATSLDGRLAQPPAGERWISSAQSRALVHALRGRVDAILVGIGTALADDPLLTPRPAGPRRPLRIVLDSTARLPLTSRLVATVAEAPVLVAVGPRADPVRCAELAAAGCEVWHGPQEAAGDRLAALLADLGRRRLTNLLLEGGAAVLHTAFAAGLVDEVWGFVAPLIGGTPELGAGPGPVMLPEVPPLEIEEVSHPGGDIFVRGLVQRPPPGLISPADRGSCCASA